MGGPAPGEVADAVDLFDASAWEDAWEAPEAAYDLVVAVGTLDTVNGLPTALRLIRHAMRANGLFIGALSGGNTLPQLRAAMRAADAVSGAASPHAHPRIEPAALAPLLEQAGFVRPVVDIDRVQVAYASLARLIGDLRAMAATNILLARPSFIGRAAHAERGAGLRRGRRMASGPSKLSKSCTSPPGRRKAEPELTVPG